VKQLDTRNLEYFEALASNRKKIRSRHRYYWNDITNYVQYFVHENSSVLEVGCGTGEMLHELVAAKKTGIDYSEAMIAQAKKSFPELDLRVMNANNIQLEGTYDVIILSNLIGFVDDIQHVFLELKKVCHPNTKVIVSFYNTTWEPFLGLAEKLGLKTKSPQQNWLTHFDINNLLYLAGFDVYRQVRRMLIPFNIPIISYITNKYLAKLPILRSLCINMYSFAMPYPNSEKDVDSRYSVSIVIPARNESGNIENAILRMPKFSNHQEIIFVEGNSTDDTWDTIQKIKQKYDHTHDIKITQQTGKGKGDAVRKGFGMATGDILMILDADLTMPPEELPKFYNAIAGYKGDFINGSRLVYAMDEKAMRFLNRLGNKFFSQAFTWLLEQKFRDTLCGTKVIFRKDYEKLIINRKFFGDFDPFGDFDLLFGAYKLNLKIVEIPIRYKDRTYGDTNISRFKHGFMLLQMCIFAMRKCKFY